MGIYIFNSNYIKQLSNPTFKCTLTALKSQYTSVLISLLIDALNQKGGKITLKDEIKITHPENTSSLKRV